MSYRQSTLVSLGLHINICKMDLSGDVYCSPEYAQSVLEKVQFTFTELLETFCKSAKKATPKYSYSADRSRVSCRCVVGEQEFCGFGDTYVTARVAAIQTALDTMSNLSTASKKGAVSDDVSTLTQEERGGLVPSFKTPILWDGRIAKEPILSEATRASSHAHTMMSSSSGETHRVLDVGQCYNTRLSSEAPDIQTNYVGILNEYCLSHVGNVAPMYTDHGKVSGPDHQPTFSFSVKLDRRPGNFVGQGVTKKIAKQQAAKKLLDSMGIC